MSEGTDRATSQHNDEVPVIPVHYRPAHRLAAAVADLVDKAARGELGGDRLDYTDLDRVANALGSDLGRVVMVCVARHRMKDEIGHEPTPEELAENVLIPPEYLRKLLEFIDESIPAELVRRVLAEGAAHKAGRADGQGVGLKAAPQLVCVPEGTEKLLYLLL